MSVGVVAGPSLPFSPLPQDQTFPLLSTANVWFAAGDVAKVDTLELSRRQFEVLFTSPTHGGVVAELAVRALAH